MIIRLALEIEKLSLFFNESISVRQACLLFSQIFSQLLTSFVVSLIPEI